MHMELAGRPHDRNCNAAGNQFDQKQNEHNTLRPPSRAVVALCSPVSSATRNDATSRTASECVVPPGVLCYAPPTVLQGSSLDVAPDFLKDEMLALKETKFMRLNILPSVCRFPSVPCFPSSANSIVEFELESEVTKYA